MAGGSRDSEWDWTLEQRKERKKEDQETYARLTAPEHEMPSYFREHQRVEGYQEDRDAQGFLPCDRLLKLDTAYGRIQLGYHPVRGVSFLFAHIKTSIFDIAPARYQREIREKQMFRQIKRETQNVSYTARRRKDSSIVLYLFENKPWSARSVEPYLRYSNPGTIAKTMPFLSLAPEKERLEQLAEEKRQVGRQIQESLHAGGEETAFLRQRDTEILREREMVQSLLLRKQSRAQHFFSRVNITYDQQKHEMFQYYREQRRQRAESASAVPVEKNEGEEDE